MEAMFSSNILHAMPKSARAACRSSDMGLGMRWIFLLPAPVDTWASSAM